MFKNYIFFISLVFYCFTISSCSGEKRQNNGYVDADLIYVSSDFGGMLESIYVQRGDYVNYHQSLYRLEQVTESNNISSKKEAVASLEANLTAAKNQLQYAKLNYKRQSELAKHGFYNQNSLDLLLQNIKVTENQIKSIQSQINASQVEVLQGVWQKSKKDVIAMQSGIVFDTYFAVGEYVGLGSPVISLVTESAIKVVFYLPETDLAKVTLGQKITINMDGSSNVLDGKINYIANRSEYTPPIIYSQEQRQKLVYRIEAKIQNPDLHKIHLGQPVVIKW